MKNTSPLKPLARWLAQTVLLSALPTTLWAYDLGTVSSGSGASTSSAAPVDAAPTVAPTQGSLTATEPQSIISQQYMQETMTGASNYIEAAAIAPGVWAYSPNGPGGNDNPGLTLRGFQDGQYNMLFDGIPFYDGADFTHHATSYILGEDTGSIVVDRGPGRASTVGDATFGGTIALNSKAPMSDPMATVRYQLGSFNSQLAGFQLDTGVMQNYGDASAVIDYNHFKTDGALTNNNMNRGNLFAKFIKPINEDTTVTLVAMQNQSYQNASQGATAAQIAKYGSNYGLTLDPTSQGYVGYNNDNFTSNFDYLGIQSHQGSWRLDDKLYANSYAHNAMQGADPSGLGVNGTVNGPNNIPGITGLTQYTTFGNVFRATDAIGNDDLGTGVWIERQLHHSWNNSVDLTNGMQLGSQGEETSSLNTIQPYVEYVWRPTDKWSITPGLKYSSITRTQLNSYFGPPTDGSSSAHYSAALPSLDIHYYMNDHWSAYGQASEGFLAPLLSYMTTASNPSSLAPQKTENFQIGSVYKTNKLTASADMYYITNNNLIQVTQQFGANGLPVFANAGAVQYRGVEGEATYNVAQGFNLYGNYTFESISSASANPILNAPQVMTTLGMLYNQGPVNASLLAKEIGRRYTGTDANGNNVMLGSYTVANFAAGYKLSALNGWAKNASVQFQVDNIFNRNDMIAQVGNAAATGDPTFWTLFGRIYNISLSSSF